MSKENATKKEQTENEHQSNNPAFLQIRFLFF